MNNNVIIACAFTGAGAISDKNPHVTMAQKIIADSSVKFHHKNSQLFIFKFR